MDTGFCRYDATRAGMTGGVFVAQITPAFFCHSDGYMEKSPCVYILASKRHGTLYTGVTSNLPKRIWEHRESLVHGFTKKYGVKMLVFFEMNSAMEDAIRREKQIKEWKRGWKIELIEKINPGWDDLYDEICR